MPRTKAKKKTAKAKKKATKTRRKTKKAFTMTVADKEPDEESTAKAMSQLAIVQSVADLKPGQPIPIHLWGRDHWSTFAYVETRLVDYKGRIDRHHMRGHHCGDDSGYPTRLAGEEEMSNHGDYDCLFDAEAAGLLVLTGTGLHPVIKKLTKQGALVAAALRAHKAEGGFFRSYASCESSRVYGQKPRSCR